MNRKSHVTPREKFLRKRARALPPELRRDLELVHLCFLTPEEFHSFGLAFTDAILTAAEGGTIGLLCDAMYAFLECLRLGVAVPD